MELKLNEKLQKVLSIIDYKIGKEFADKNLSDLSKTSIRVELYIPKIKLPCNKSIFLNVDISALIDNTNIDHSRNFYIDIDFDLYLIKNYDEFHSSAKNELHESLINVFKSISKSTIYLECALIDKNAFIYTFNESTIYELIEKDRIKEEKKLLDSLITTTSQSSSVKVNKRRL